MNAHVISGPCFSPEAMQEDSLKYLAMEIVMLLKEKPAGYRATVMQDVVRMGALRAKGVTVDSACP